MGGWVVPCRDGGGRSDVGVDSGVLSGCGGASRLLSLSRCGGDGMVSARSEARDKR